LFIPSFLEVPCFRFDLGSFRNNCDEAADVRYDISSPAKYVFRITPRTRLTRMRLRLMQLKPGESCVASCRWQDAKELFKEEPLKADEAGTVACEVADISRSMELVIRFGR